MLTWQGFHQDSDLWATDRWIKRGESELLLGSRRGQRRGGGDLSGAQCGGAGGQGAMSGFSGASFAPGFRRASGRREAETRSPIPYREGAMDYEPPKLCHCNPPRKAPRWISWSRQNPGRRYYACVHALVSSISPSIFHLQVPFFCHCLVNLIHSFVFILIEWWLWVY